MKMGSVEPIERKLKLEFNIFAIVSQGKESDVEISLHLSPAEDGIVTFLYMQVTELQLSSFA